MAWRASVLTIFPEMFPGPLGVSLAGKALAGGLWSLQIVDIRDFATDKHRSVDDTPAGGGPGMVMKPDVLARAVDRAGREWGTVVAVHNFGAGDLIELRPANGAQTELLPFDAATVPEVDIAHGRLVIERPTSDPEMPPPLRGRPTAKRSGGG